MKKYLMIKNKGKIIAQDLIILGSSSKRDNDAKIGQFGTGSKFGLSYLLRKDCAPIIYSGKNMIPIETRMTEHRGTVREIVFINGENTNTCTDFGMKWTAWMALREFVSNAIDEGDEEVKVIYEDDLSKMIDDQDVTRIFIPVNNDIQHVIDNYEHYFAFDRKPDYVGVNGALYIKENLGPINIYRKGIRCYDTMYNSYVDFNLANADITEDRLLETGMSEFDRRARKLLQECDNVEVIKAVIKTPDYRDHFIGELKDYPTWITAYTELINEGAKFTSKSYRSILGLLVANYHIIPSGHYKTLITLGLVDDPMDAAFNHLDFTFARTDGPSTEVEKILSSLGAFKVYFGKMDSYQDVKFKTLHNEFYVLEKYVKEDHYHIAARCLKAHPDYVNLVAKLLQFTVKQ